MCSTMARGRRGCATASTPRAWISRSRLRSRGGASAGEAWRFRVGGPLALPLRHPRLAALLLIVVAGLLDDGSRRRRRLDRVHLGREMAPRVGIHQILLVLAPREQ